MQLRELLSDVDVLDVRGDPTVDVRALAHDSRDVDPGTCFACIVGANADGHDHAPAAVAAGAVALLVERRLGLTVPEARVPNVRQALGPAAARLHGFPSLAMRCLGVTGTNGKTTTTHLLAAIARAAGEPAGVVGTVGARIDDRPLPLEHTTPEATELQALLARMRDDGIRTVAMEVSSHALAQHRVDGTHFAVACFTNLSPDHLDYHDSLDDYFEAKARLFDPAVTAAAAVNLDDPRGPELVRRCHAAGCPSPATRSTRPPTSAPPTSASTATADGSPSSSLTGPGPRCTRRCSVCSTSRTRSPRPSRRVSPASASDAVGEGLAAVAVVPGRLEPVDTGQPFDVLVDYAHTPAALTAALDAARRLAGPHRVIVVFGAGGDRDATKRPLMGRAAADGADVVIVTSDNPRSEDAAAIADAVLAGATGGPAATRRELDRRAAIRGGLDAARPGDVVLIAGKGHETVQRVGSRSVDFDDRVVALEELEGRRWN